MEFSPGRGTGGSSGSLWHHCLGCATFPEDFLLCLDASLCNGNVSSTSPRGSLKASSKTLLAARGWTRRPLKVPSSPTYSMTDNPKLIPAHPFQGNQGSTGSCFPPWFLGLSHLCPLCLQAPTERLFLARVPTERPLEGHGSCLETDRFPWTDKGIMETLTSLWVLLWWQGDIIPS